MTRTLRPIPRRPLRSRSGFCDADQARESSLAALRDRRFSRPRHGFTLVELLVAVTIMVILASATLFATFSARESARVAATQSTISKLNAMVMKRWDEYHTRRVPVIIGQGTGPKQAASDRLNGLQQIMRLELPQRWVEVTAPPSNPLQASARPAVNYAYLAYHSQFNPTTEHEGAECLYMIVSEGMVDEAGGIDQFSDAEIDDVDGDGANEFVDAWGTPISFLRSAPGFASDIQIRNAAQSPNPFDVMREDGESWATFPLIYSAGPDREFNINRGNSGDVTDNAFSSAAGEAIGSLEDGNSDGHFDNIHNHAMKATF